MDAEARGGANGTGWKKAGWTLKYPELGTGSVSYESCISPEFFELEREAVFRRRWLCVGYVTQVPGVGNYFTKELEVCKTSILVVRGKDNVIRAFHNVCAHRGNKLVWTDDPLVETAGTCRLFRCKYHGWTYELDGNSHKVSDEPAFFDLDKAKLGLIPIHCSVWRGWIFVNLANAPSDSLEEAMGEIGAGLKGLPVEQMTTQYKYVADIRCNWKVVTDAFIETYHSAYLHGGLRPDIGDGAVLNHAIHFEADSRHNRLASYFGGKGDTYSTPVERLLGAGIFGPSDMPDFGFRTMQDLPPKVNPTRDPQWGLDAISLNPNLELLIWQRNWLIVYHYWPLAHDRTRFEIELCFVPPKNARQRVAQELTRTAFKDIALQDVNLLPGTYQMLQSRVRRQFYLGDEEFMLRHLHYTIARDVEAYKASLNGESGART